MTPATSQFNTVGVGVGVAADPVGDGDSLGDGVAGQPRSAAPTAATSSLTVTSPLSLESQAAHRSTGTRPRAMFTPLTSSDTATSPLPSQSPLHVAAAGSGRVATQSATRSQVTMRSRTGRGLLPSLGESIRAGRSGERKGNAGNGRKKALCTFHALGSAFRYCIGPPGTCCGPP